MVDLRQTQDTGRARLAAIARVVAASARAVEEQNATANRIRALAQLGRLGLDPQRWMDALREAVAHHEKIGVVPSLFDVMGLHGSERHHNRALAWLLAPNAAHGAGRAVLLALARALGCDVLVADLADPSVLVEVRGERQWPDGAGSTRMPDLLVLSPRALLLIENKVGAGEGPQQYADYAEALQVLAKRRPSVIERRLFLAAPQARETPAEWTGTIRHADLARWVAAAARSTELSVWDRVLCVLVAEEISPGERAKPLREAKHLLAHAGRAGFRARDVREAQQIVEQLGEVVDPWRE